MIFKMATDAHLRKEIDYLSSLIKSHKDAKKEPSPKVESSSGRYNWTKNKNGDKKHRATTKTLLSHRETGSEKSHSGSKTSTSVYQYEGTGAKVQQRLPIARKSKDAKSPLVLPGSRNSSSSSTGIELDGSVNPCKLNKAPKILGVSKRSDLKWTKTIPRSEPVEEDSKSHSDSEIYMGMSSTGGNVKTKVTSLGLNNTVSASMSSFSARLSLLSSSLATASLKLQPVTSKQVPIKSNVTSKSLSSPPTSISLTLCSSSTTPSSATTVNADANMSSYKWNKSQTSQTGKYSLNTKKRSTKKSKASPGDLIWTKPELHPETQRSGPALMKTRAEKSSRKAESTTSGHNKHVWTASKTQTTGSSSKDLHVWRSQNLQVSKLDKRKIKSVTTCTSSTSHQAAEKGFIERRKNVVLKDPPRKSVITRYSVIHTKRKAPIKAEKSSKVVIIEGVAYKSSANKLQKAKPAKTEQEKKAIAARKDRRSSLMLNIRGEKFVMDTTGKTLKRINPVMKSSSSPVPGTSRDTIEGVQIRKSSTTEHTGKRRLSVKRIFIGGVLFIETAPGVLVRSSQQGTMMPASHVLHKSVHKALKYKYKRKAKKKPRYCTQYNRYGKCNKGDKCPFIHDASKVAVCTKFLCGTCKNTDGPCLFSHKVDRDKMPACRFFLRGTCSKDNCPYSHVNVSSKARVCKPFLKGYCPRGQQCKKKHTLFCEEFSFMGKKCKEPHRTKRKRKEGKRKSSVNESEPQAKRPALHMTEDEGFLPLIQDQDSVLEDTEKRQETANKQQVEPIAIRPRFLVKKNKEG